MKITATHWAAFTAAWLAVFAVLEWQAFRTNTLTLSHWVHDLNTEWPILTFIVGAVVGGLAVHFYWHWMPAGAKSVG